MNLRAIRILEFRASLSETCSSRARMRKTDLLGVAVNAGIGAIVCQFVNRGGV